MPGSSVSLQRALQERAAASLAAPSAYCLASSFVTSSNAVPATRASHCRGSFACNSSTNNKQNFG